MSTRALTPAILLADEFAGAGLSTPAAIPADKRTDRAWVIVKRGTGGAGAVTVANAYLVGVDADEDAIRIATLGSMNIAATEDGFAVLVSGVGAWEALAFNSDAIAADTVDVYVLFIED